MPSDGGHHLAAGAMGTEMDSLKRLPVLAMAQLFSDESVRRDQDSPEPGVVNVAVS